MKRHTKGSVMNISIHGDEVENHRIQLENNLQHTDLSLRLSSTSDDDEYHNHLSIEYPRHNSGPTAFADFASFENPSRDHFDGDSHMHPWSFRTAEDDEGINPYSGETMSTAAHHASALTLSAGLGGGRAARRDISLSGAEYDPDRPLHNMMAGVDSKLSIFDIEASRSKYPGVGSVTFDPVVVDNTAELDRVLQSGYAPALNHHIHSPLPSSSSSSSDSESNHTSRPKLADALRRVSFSPKRPRSAQSNKVELRHHPASPLARSKPLPSTNDTQNIPTPRPKRRNGTPHPTPATPGPQHPQVRLQPPTPSSASSQFSKMARGLTKEIQHEQHERVEGSAAVSSSVNDRYPLETSAASIKQPTPRRASSLKHPTPRGKVHLPDVTGLTSAVESPAKAGAGYYFYRADEGPRENEARLLMVLNNIQSKLQHLEEENGISRRRVRELELELEVCKRDVAKERTRVMEREEIIVQQQRDASSILGTRRNKGKARAKDISMDNELLHERYREAVEEKKALEALITTLRTHLSRLTSELSSHKELLTELRELRESDSRALKQKSAEIDRLKDEVERLGGEVEVLRGVVEEGLKERRSVRDVSVVHESLADLGMSQDMEDEGEVDDVNEQGTVHGEERDHHERDHHDEETGDEDEEEEEEEDAAPFDPVSILGSSRNTNAGHPDRTMRTDHATAGSSNHAESTPDGPFTNSAEFERISAEVEERRSSTQPGSTGRLQSFHHSINPHSPMRRASVEDIQDQDEPRAPSPITVAPSRHLHGHSQTSPPARPRAPTPAQQPTRQPRRSSRSSPMEETPFPQIRGTHLERLFFSAPEHNAKTCTVCHRRQRSNVEPSWVPSRFRGQNERGHPERNEADEDDEDEGFAEGSEQQHHERVDAKDQKGKQRERVTFSEDPGPWRQRAQREGLPPQTVVARVIRELEDDFTHYKGIYVELADQYKDMDAVSDVPKRNVLAKHLREVVDILEQKGDQIASLYDLLSFKDKPVSESVLPTKTRSVSTTAVAPSSLGRRAGAGMRRDPLFA